MNTNILVTDCDTKHGFAIARSLKKNKLNIVSQYRNKINPFYFSIRNRRKTLFDFRDKDHIQKFIKYLEKNRPEVLMPVSNLSVKMISDHRKIISQFTKLLLPSVESLEIAQNKYQTFKFAEELGIRCPKTIYDTRNISDLNKAIEDFSFPVVLKFVNVNETGVRYCKSLEEVKSILHNYNKSNTTPPILQEFIEGTGVGFYALYKDGIRVNYFMHKRLHEYPVTGGASSFAVSIYDEELKKVGTKILDALKWNGIAMIEFKLTDNNELYLIEINPKFWGSYELSEKCGINFAHDYYKVAIGQTVINNKYRVDIGFRWIFSEIMYHRDKLFLNINEKKSAKKHTPKKVYNDLYLDEPLIFIVKIFDILIRIFFKKTNPHSSPYKNIN